MSEEEGKTRIEPIADVIELGGCVVLGIGATPDRYRFLLQDGTNQDYLVIGARDSVDADFIAMRMGGRRLKPKPIAIHDLEMDAYLIRNDEVAG